MAGWNAPSTRSSASFRCSAVIRQRAELAGQCDWWWKRPSSGDWSPESAGKPSAYCSSTTTSNRGGKKMWCVADLNEDYIAKMEDVLGMYERPYDPEQPVVCLDEKPVTLHADVRPASPATPGRAARADNEKCSCVR